MKDDGYLMLPSVFSSSETATIAKELDEAVRADEHHVSAVARGDVVVAARNVLEAVSPATSLWRRPLLVQFLSEVLAPSFGLMRGLFFDSRREVMALPWHPGSGDCQSAESIAWHRIRPKPTTKSGVPQCRVAPLALEADCSGADSLRRHGSENGPLQVMLGSHREETENSQHQEVKLFCSAWGCACDESAAVSSQWESVPGCRLHRRILHLEFTGCPVLPDGMSGIRLCRGFE